jgi:hypothetical protein
MNPSNTVQAGNRLVGRILEESKGCAWGHWRETKGGLESLAPGRVSPLGMRHQSNSWLLNCTKGDLSSPRQA